MCSCWVVLAFCCLGQLCADQSLKPQIAAPQLATNNPTLTTVALEKPFCMFDSSLCPNKSYVIYLYAMKESGDVNKVSDVLKQYLFRVGDDGTCLYDPNFLAVCNPPLAPGTTYRFKYVLVDSTEGIMKDQTLWSDPIKTRRVKLPLKIDTWPGRRSGGMIVITSILSVLVFLLLAGFLASVTSAVMGSEDSSAETRHVSQTIQQSEPRPQLSSE
ncbi:uroplakin-3a isoform 2-T3 [Sarcoramphus papa]|uniref:uroplakin-3a isoform X2 n=1 Tax=Gymnogyps californianus TaxID=33616 RepID=UPI0021C6909B|nr:uroplakin-3a isoform X2 [Gymnogyps californianus]